MNGSEMSQNRWPLSGGPICFTFVLLGMIQEAIPIKQNGLQIILCDPWARQLKNDENLVHSSFNLHNRMKNLHADELTT